MKSKSFTLRRAKAGDLKSWYNYYQDKDTERNFMRIPCSLKEARKELFEKKADKFVVDVDGEAVGTVEIHDIVSKHKAIISYWIAKKCRGKGIMTAAVKLMTEYSFKKYKLRRLQGNVRTFNKASARVLEKAGYKLEGILRKNKFKNGKYLDDMVYAFVR